MSRAGLAGLPGNRRPRCKIPGPPTAADRVGRQFTRRDPDRLWVTSITEHPTKEGKVYCAVESDTFSRRVVGWSIDSSPTATLVTFALGIAINNRTPTDQSVIHSDLSNTRRGRSPAGHKSPGSSRRWDRSAIASTAP
jgi:putative transposase